MNAVVVAYRWSPAKERALIQLTRGLIDPRSVLIVENHQVALPVRSHFVFVRGTNRYAEFSGYLEGLEKQTPGPTLVINDTALIHHSIIFWRAQIAKWIRSTHQGIHGDPRHEQLVIEHGNLSYLASWIFWLPSAAESNALVSALQDVIRDWDVVFSSNPSYRVFINKYLRGSLFHGWKNSGLRDQKAQDLKIRCIWAEHRLSRIILDKGYHILDLKGSHVVPMRALDRLFSFRRRAQSFLT